MKGILVVICMFIHSFVLCPVHAHYDSSSEYYTAPNLITMDLWVPEVRRLGSPSSEGPSGIVPKSTALQTDPFCLFAGLP